MARMSTGAPAQKVTVAAAAAALVSVAIALLPEEWTHLTQFKAEIVTVATFLAGYFMPPSPNDQISGS